MSALRPDARQNGITVRGGWESGACDFARKSDPAAEIWQTPTARPADLLRQINGFAVLHGRPSSANYRPVEPFARRGIGARDEIEMTARLSSGSDLGGDVVCGQQPL
jgi:hypothetical protein